MFKKLLCIFIVLFAWLNMATQPVFARDVSLANNQILLTPTHGGDGSAWGQSNCINCHVLRNIHKTVPAIKGIVQDVGYRSCTGCHGQNGTNVQRECIVCHNSERLPKSPLQHAEKNHNFTVKQDAPLTDENCIICHDHSDMDKKFEPAVDLTHFKGVGLDLPYQNNSEFCLRCHNEDHQPVGFAMKPRFLRDPLVMMEKNYRFIDMHGYPEGSGQRTYSGLRSHYQYPSVVDCTDCHAMHGTHNTKLIVDRTDAGMKQLKAGLRLQPVLINVPLNGDYSQLCVTCHQMSDIVEQGDEDTGNGLSGVHQVSSDCRVCHVHGMAAQTGL
ncbi:multiheme c-type cytochrome [methanotrophic endosymbiont of Bathymodiolus puteoserpentis (Logatchev)]|jgi:hypothetical protein|uniref:multiheme c-type cytochrome n=1 Tax=methanotrophic endosymbiont of Bathymodiolus puteoserpentis (Logatchev) TaxID=343235 RepID=UPI0013C6C077|nr:cytochrome c3 family protein [methanotrophic endosymbiont of Bathymodiolus puteoserpentis (Logatchev)]SHE21625.1 hypothetical protein BPUTEOMOX_1079 [methanotrophic endosymbiont of Bathymodiolus puteoserpentis (Logatchev)]